MDQLIALLFLAAVSAIVILLVLVVAFLCGRIVIECSERIPLRKLGWSGACATVWRGLCLLPGGWSPPGEPRPMEAGEALPCAE